MEIEVGEYVRTTTGEIEKIKKIAFDDDVLEEYYCFEKNFKEAYIEDIANHSKNIIDLIEVGDYVNGVMVESMNNSIKPIPIPQYKNENGEYVDYDESEIKSIVTKEQFKNIEYRLE
jgi:hypothetical protein